MATTKLAHVNVPPAQTWNYLRINEIGLEVSVPQHTGEVFSRLPRIFDAVESGIGDEAAAWIVSSAEDSSYVEVPARTQRQEPVVVDVDADAGDVRDAGVLVREGAEATVVVVSHGGRHKATGEAGASSMSAVLVRIIAERGATVHVIQVSGMEADRQHLAGIGIDAAEDAVVEVCQYALGGGRVALGLAANLAGSGARLALDSRYVARGTEVLDINHVVRQRGRKTKADIRTQGILSDAAHKTMRETIDLVHGAKGSMGNEVETVLVCGDEVVNKTLPVILCDEDDVAGNHGASIGSVSPEQLGYLADRGLAEGDAEHLFARAIFDDAAIHAPEGVSLACALDSAAAYLGEDVANDAAEALGLGRADA